MKNKNISITLFLIIGFLMNGCSLISPQIPNEVLSSYFSINKSMALSNEEQNITIERLYQMFDREIAMNPSNPSKRKYYDYALFAKKTVQEARNLISQYRDQLIDLSGNIDGKHDSGDHLEGDMSKAWKGEANTEVGEVFFGSNNRGDNLKNIILDVRTKLIRCVGENNKGFIKIDESVVLPFKSNFKSLPLSYIIMILTKYETDLLNSQKQVVLYLLGDITTLGFPN
jgi:hypothetical protein